jgi:hypothetical protein
MGFVITGCANLMILGEIPSFLLVYVYQLFLQKCSYVSNQSNEVQRRAKSIRSL